jgi:hypothetical protein
MTAFRNYLEKSTVFLLFLLFAVLADPILGQIVVDEAPRGLYYNRTARVKKFKDMKNARDLFHCDKYLMGRNRISGNVSFNFQRVIVDDGVKRKPEFRSAMSIFSRYRFFEEFSFNSTFFIDFNKRAAARWIADYTYSIGRYNWRPRKFNFGYENYVNNKYTDNLDEFSQKFMEGYYFASYNFVFPDNIAEKIRIDSTSNVKFTPFARFAFRYRDEFEAVHYEGKPTIGIQGRITLFWNIYCEGGLYYYFQPVFRQLPWDPDFTFGFGHFNWKAFRLSLTYGNWAINRFRGKNQIYNDYGFIDGNFKFTFNWIW